VANEIKKGKEQLQYFTLKVLLVVFMWEAIKSSVLGFVKHWLHS
jgi:hypothetical protein